MIKIIPKVITFISLLCKSFMFLFFININSFADEGSQEQVKKSFGEIGIGKGFISYNNQVLPSGAVVGYDVVKTAPEGFAELSFVEDKGDLLKKVGIHGSLEVPVKALQFKNLTSFLDQHKNSHRTISFLYKADWNYRFELQSRSGDRIQISDEALDVYGKSPRDFVSGFGNSFITKSRAGASIFIMLKLHFDSSEAKKSFQDNMGIGKEGIITVLQKLQYFKEQNHEQGYFNLHVLQLGGTPESLGEMFAQASSTATGLASDSGSKKNSKKDFKSHGAESIGYNFTDLENGIGLINKVTEYLTALPNQVDSENPETLFVFGDFETQSYHSINGDIAPLTDGSLKPETLKARKKISKAFINLHKLREIKIPFYTYAHFKEKMRSNVSECISRAKEYRDKLEDFFDSSPANSQFQCYQTGFEDEACPKALQKLSAFKTAELKDDLKKIELLNYSVSVTNRYASYPINWNRQFLDRSHQQKVRQDLVSFNLDQQDVEGHYIVFDAEDNSSGESISMQKLALDRDNMIYSFGLMHYNLALTGSAIKTESNVFEFTQNFKSFEPKEIKCKGEKITFYDDFYFPHQKGHVCLYLPAGAGFVANIKNKSNNKSAAVSVFKTGKIFAQIGDEIEIKPAWSRSKPHIFKVTVPYDTENDFEDMTKKLPLHSTVHLKGNIVNNHTTIIYHDENCF